MNENHLKAQGIISNKDESLKIYNNKFLDSLTHAYPTTLLCIYLPVIIYFSYRPIQANLLFWLLGFIFGGFLWTIIEYFMHRFLFHYEPKYDKVRKIFYLIHEIHHAYPRDSTRLVTPPIVSLLFVVMFYFFYQRIFGANSAAIFSGTLFLYLIYETGHYAIHHYNSKNRFARYLKRHHLAHHYLDNKNYFGVTSPLWDFVFCTKPPIFSASRTGKTIDK